LNATVQSFFEGMKGKKVAFAGIGVSNEPLIKQFIDAGAIVTACDKNTDNKNGELAKRLLSLGITVKFGGDYLDNLDADIIFRTPGMMSTNKKLMDYAQKGVVVTSEMEVFFDLCPCNTIAVTGSDGKTTTTTLISLFLKQEGKKVFLGGNIGTPLLPQIGQMNQGDFAVAELSSFQLMSMRKSPDIAVVTNLAPNHLDKHTDMNEYIEAKKNIFAHQNAFSKTVLNPDNEITASFASLIRGDLYYFSRHHEVFAGAYVENDNIYMREKNGNTTFVCSLKDIKLPGNHNIENYLTAITAVWGLVSVQSITEVAKSFGGVEHRMEFVRELGGVKYYNDSIATSPTRVIGGTLSYYKEKIIIIAGGSDKDIPFDALGDVICQKVKMLILLGKTSQKIYDAVTNSSYYSQNNPVIIFSGSMEEAVAKARDSAKKGDIVSLCPACASFDMYKNFEVRGQHFKQVVKELI